MNSLYIKGISTGIFLFILMMLGLFLFQNIVNANSQSGYTRLQIIDPNSIQGNLTAIPEKRIPNVNETQVQNLSTLMRLKFYHAGADRTNEANVVTTTMVTTSDSGTEYYYIDAFTTSSFDVVGKGYSHLSRALTGVTPVNGVANLDFTNSGADPLLSGDINQSLGDDEINALDISVLVNAWGQDDSRADLNQDHEVNSIDISNLLSNFNETGD